MWGEVMYPLAAAAAATVMGVFPASLETLQALSLQQVTAWLNAMGWTVDFIVSFIYCMMSVVGVLTDKRECQIQYSSKLHRTA